MYKLLIIDDEMDTREDIYKFMFADRFSIVCIKSNEDELCKVLQEHYFDCIILDNNLNDNLCKEDVLQILEQYNYPIIMVSNIRKFSLKEYDKECFIDCISLSQIFALRDMNEIQGKEQFQEKFIKDLCDRVERDIFYHRGYDNLEKDKLVICHVSDVQFCDPHTNENDLRTLFDKLGVFVLNFDSHIDVLVITGDIVFSGKKKEFLVAKEVIEKFKDTMRRNRHEIEILFVPGNHDFDYQCFLLDVDEKYMLDDTKLDKMPSLNNIDGFKELTITPDLFIDFEANANYLENFKFFSYAITKNDSYLKENFFIRCEKFAKSGFAIEGINNAYKFHKNKDDSKRYMYEYSSSLFGNFESTLYTIMAGHVAPKELGYMYTCKHQLDRCNETTFKNVCANDGKCEKWGDMEQIFDQCNTILYLCGHVHYSDIEISDDKSRLYVSAASPTGVNPNEKTLNIIELENKDEDIEVTISRYDAKPSGIAFNETSMYKYKKEQKGWEKIT